MKSSGPIGTIIIAFAAMMIAGSAPASIALVEETHDASGTTWRLVYTPRPVRTVNGVTIGGIDETVGAGGSVEVSRREAALIATPEMAKFNAREWSVEAEGHAAEAVLKPVTVGTTQGVSLSLLPLTADTKPINVTVKTTAGLPPSKLSPPDSSGIFLNAVVTGDKDTTPRSPDSLDLPMPIAAEKETFPETEKGRIIALQTTTTNPGIIYHAELLAKGGSTGALWVYVPRLIPSIAEEDAVMIGGSTPSPTMTTRAAFSTLTAGGVELTQQRSHLYDFTVVYDRAASLPLGERFTAYRIVGSPLTEPQKTTTLHIDDIVTNESFHASVTLLGITDVVGTTPDHYAYIGMEGFADFYTGVWDNGDNITMEAQFPLTGGKRRDVRSVTAGRDIKIVHTVFVGGSISVDGQGLKSVNLSWEGKPRIDARGSCTMDLAAAAGPRLVTIGGFPADATANDIIVLDVSNETTPVRIANFSLFTDESGTKAVEFEAGAAAATFYAQRVASSATTTAKATSHLPSLPRSNYPDHLSTVFVISEAMLNPPPDLAGENSLNNILITPQAAYDTYSYGQESPDAIRQALRDVINAFPSRAEFPNVILVGNATFDPHNYLHLNSGERLPTFIDESVPSATGSTVTIESCVDAGFAKLFGDDDLPDASVGRIPAKTTGELALILSRIRAHEKKQFGLSSQSRPAIFTTDYDPETVTPDAEFWETLWQPTGLPSQNVNALDYVYSDGGGAPDTFHPTQMNAAIKSALQVAPHGPSIFFYFGHGNYNVWGPSGQQYFSSGDLPSITTQDNWPIVLTFTCFNGYYALPGAPERALGEQWLLQQLTGGAVADVATGGIDYYDSQRSFSIEALNLLALAPPDRPTTVGELMTRTRIAFLLKYPDLVKTADIYILFGDPRTQMTLSPVGNGFLVK